MNGSKDVLIIGGGIAGIQVALGLAGRGKEVVVLEKLPFPGGHGIRFSCKATDACVKCGACLVEQKLMEAVEHPGIEIRTGGRMLAASRSGNVHRVTFEQTPVVISPEKCTRCGECIDVCPEPGALIPSPSAAGRPPMALDSLKCRVYRDGTACSLCSDRCPEKAFRFDAAPETLCLEAGAVVLASGFHAFQPVDKPYGYGIFPNVITNLELETMLRTTGGVRRPSDGETPARIAFIQCVGSRDASLDHLWCSRVCCGSALRMARLMRWQNPTTDITVFYMDIQTFGGDFEPFYGDTRRTLRFVRAIPGDIYPFGDDRLELTFFDPMAGAAAEAQFDLVVLSVGITPAADFAETAANMGFQKPGPGFLAAELLQKGAPAGLFAAGTVKGPMSIADTMTDADHTAWQVLRYLEKM